MYDAPAPGWYHDPTNPGAQRWWDGSQWGDAVAPLPVAQHTAAPMPAPPLHYGAGPYATAPTQGQWAPRKLSFTDANKMSLITLAVAAAYLVMAASVHLVLIGFIPISCALRANAAKEPMRFVAIAAAVAVFGLGLLAFVG